MLTITERYIFTFMLTVLVLATAAAFYGIFSIVRAGRAAPPLKGVPRALAGALIEVGLQKTIFRARPTLSIFHAFIFFWLQLLFPG